MTVPAEAPLYQMLWAKADRLTGRMHPLICHMLDVAEVTLTMWDAVLTGGIRRHFSELLRLNADEAGRLLAFWASLHDLGKASPAFQRKVPAFESALKSAGLDFPQVFTSQACPHGTVTTWSLEQTLQTATGLAPRPARRIALAVGGHHGSWPPPGATNRLRAEQVGGSRWNAVRSDLVCTLMAVLKPPACETWIANRTDENTFITLFSGLASVADWIGSMESYFAYAELPVDPQSYAATAAECASRALSDLNWTGWQPPVEARRFDELFPFQPSIMQEAVIDLAAHLKGPSLVMIEAPTGMGKTEAGLFLADRWAVDEQQRGTYVAMPTMATTNQMHGRVKEMLRRRYGTSAVEPLLVHSQARWIETAPPPTIVTDDERTGSSVQSMTWFLPRKRSLLAPFGVGTVDQSLMSVLQTRHFFVRLFGLSHKTVIFDEVHAYDTYMSTLFQRLLSWLKAIGSSVVLLSATLPARTRRELLAAYAGSEIQTPDATYPAITWASGDQAGNVPLPPIGGRQLLLDQITREPDAVVDCLTEQLIKGGCAAVICNTVGRAQEIYRAVRDAGMISADHLILFHARMPMAWRNEIEAKVLTQFGKDGARPHRAIVVATQVIEQSLDLDFDVMITDLAPIDLLLQRAGRLHRHERPNRPEPVATPRLLVAVSGGDPLPEFGSDSYVYEPYILLRSFLALQGHDRLTLPQETPSLIETVYGDAPLADLEPAWETRLNAARRKMTLEADQEVFEARKRLVLSPSDEALLAGLNADLEEDAPEVHATFQALTRLGNPSVALVCLHAIGEGLNTEPDGSGVAVVLDEHPDSSLTGHLARHTVSVTHRGILNHFQAQEKPPGWREHPLLRDHHAAVFNDGVCPLTGTSYTLRLSRAMGLEIART